MAVIQSYIQLYRLLKGDGVEALIERIDKVGFGADEKEAFRHIARLPHPGEASILTISQIVEDCISGQLEFAYQVSGIGELAQNIRDAISSLPDTPAEDVTVSGVSIAPPSEITSIMASQHLLLLDIGDAVNKLTTKEDIDLKGQCPYCHGPMVEVVASDGSGGHELRLRCRDQAKADCTANDWVVQNLSQRSP